MTPARRWTGAEAALIGVLAMLLLAAALRSLDQLNPDAIAYVRIAGYWARLDLGHAINGYWGPVLSWLLIPLDATNHPTLGTRLAMVVSGIVFLVACRFWFAAALDTVALRLLALGLAGATAVLAAVMVVTPDLLLAGWVLLACTALARTDWVGSPRTQVLAGALLGLAYLTKAVALPFAVLLVPGCAAARWLTRQATMRQLIAPAALTLTVTLLVAAPWIVAISAVSGKPTFSTSGAIGHAIVGPGRQSADHPYITSFQSVPDGRITVWEDPSRGPYRFWSPLESADAMSHQLRLMKQNAAAVVAVLAGVDPLRLGLVGAVLALLGLLVRRGRVATPDGVAAVACVLLPMLYLPVYTGELRYFLPLAPLLIGFGLRVAWTLDRQMNDNAAVSRPGLACCLLLAAGLASMMPLPIAAILRGRADPEYLAAKAIVSGLAAESAPPGGFAAVGGRWMTALDAAYLAGTTFNGHVERPNGDLAGMQRSGARYVVVGDTDPATRAALDHDAVRILPGLAGVTLYRLR